MVLEATFQVSKPTIHQLSQPSSKWIESIDYEQIPNFGVYLFVDQILKMQRPTIKQFRLAAKLLQKQSPITISIHPPASSNPSSFVSGMINQASDLCHQNEYAKRLKEAVQEFQARWNRDTFSDFAQSWSIFTNFLLQERVSEFLSSV